MASLLRLILLIAVVAQPLLGAPAPAPGALAPAGEAAVAACCIGGCTCADRCPCLVRAPADPAPAPERAPAPAPVDVRALLPAALAPTAIMPVPPRSPSTGRPDHAAAAVSRGSERRALLCIWTT